MDIKDLLQWTRSRAKTSHNAFLRMPSASNWRAATRDMLVYQQVEWASRSNMVDREQLLLTLTAADQKDWPGLICMATGAGAELDQMAA